MNHNDATTHADKIFNRSLVGLVNKEWRDMRSTLSPIFTSSKMKMMYELLSDHAIDFVDFLERKAKKGEVLTINAMDVFARFAADSISTTVLGFDADCVKNKDSHVYKMSRNLVHEFFGPVGSLKLMFCWALPKLYKFTGMNLMGRGTYNFIRSFVLDTMEKRERENISRPDVIQLMLQLKKGQLHSINDAEVNDKELTNFSANADYGAETKSKTVTKFTDEDWISQGFIFFAAGFDTTSQLIQMTTYELAQNPDIQRELFEEIDSIVSTLDGKPISYEVLHKMKFLDMVISESLRKWPPAVQGDRTCQKDYPVDLGNGKTITIKKGQSIFIPFHHIQRDPTYYPEPEKFDPHRFSDENKDSIIPGTYLPFGMGPRTCIGSRYALMEAKLLLFNLMEKFSIEKCDKTPEKITCNANFICNPKQEIHVKLVYRK